MSNEIYYAAITGGGQVIGVEHTVDEAIADLHDLPGGKKIAVQTIDETGDLLDRLDEGKGDAFEQNPPGDPSTMARKAFAATTIPPVSGRDAASMPLEEAHRRLLPFFSGLRLRGQEVRQYDKVLDMVDAWIGQNYKTAKAHPEQPSKVMGLALLPHHLVADMTGQPHLYGQVFTKRLAGQLPVLPEAFTFCKGSNSFCRDSCLVFAGQNASEIYNSYRKASQAAALLREPVAFVRILVEAMDRHAHKTAREGFRAYMRLNVLSDIPWELVAPWLFERYTKRQLAFYDYTKVAGRATPKNYDLTFSFSGTNEPLAQSEISLGRRVAVVFLGHKRAGDQWKAWKLKGPRAIEEIRLPRRFWGLPVVDGDVSDVRPLDPAPSIVGLRWKTPSGTRAGVTVDPQAMSFVVPVFVVGRRGLAERPNGSGGVGVWTERANPAEEQYLVAAVTPRFQPIAHDVAQPA